MPRWHSAAVLKSGFPAPAVFGVTHPTISAKRSSVRAAIAIEQVEIRANEGVVVQQVARRIPRGRQFGEHGHVRPGGARAVNRGADLSVGLLERTDREIQLRQGNAHSQFLHLAARS